MLMYFETFFLIFLFYFCVALTVLQYFHIHYLFTCKKLMVSTVLPWKREHSWLAQDMTTLL